MNLDLYNDEFFKWHYDNVHTTCVNTSRKFAKDHKFKSIIDYGCGIASYLEGCYLKGVKIKGYEISKAAKKYTSEYIQPFIEYKDFLKIQPKRYDVCLCIEVAEHIDPKNSEKLVKLLTLTSDFIVFSAATPNQEGTGHINCREKEYWIDLFEKRGFKEAQIDSFEDAPDYVVKNLMIWKTTPKDQNN